MNAEDSRLGALIRQLQGALGGNRIIRGTVNTTGPSIVEGTGFTVAKNGVGDVTITFTTAFDDVPTVTVSGMSATLYRLAQLFAPPTVTTARLLLYRETFAFSDGEIHFIAVGP